MRKEFEQIEWHLSEIEIGCKVSLNIASIRTILEGIEE